ncbi:MAG: PDDEXK nuclease domain-containing protein [Bacteroides sp.]|nr:PDDEXK nuclease domain-containing protein [Bacteroides sp.]
MNNEPTDISANKLPEAIRIAVDTIKAAIFKSQLCALKKANADQLSLYYGIGKYVSDNSRRGFWGTGALDRISEQLRREIPGLRGFSTANLKQMRTFYEQWFEGFKSVATATDLRIASIADNSIAVATEIDTSILKPSDANEVEINMDEFLGIGFTLHMEILHKTTTLRERVFYIHQTIIQQWDKYTLRQRLKDDYYHKHEHVATNNFSRTISDVRQSLRAIELFKDEYILDFINAEELGLRDSHDVDERVVEQTIIQNVKNFIMTFGRDFAFVGNQYRLEKYEVEQFPDLLFFNRELNALVCCELKYGDFKTAYLGQLAGYLKILDETVKKPHENPTIGILLCKTADKDFVEYMIQDYAHPMGVATYKTADDLPEELRRSLPDIEDLKKLL